MLKPCEHLIDLARRSDLGAKLACPACRLLATVKRGNALEVRPMVSLTRKVGCR